MQVLADGTFIETISALALGRGLRHSKRVPRDSKFLVESAGAVGIDKVLQVIDDLELSRIDTTATILDAFPYPQIFVFNRMIIVCGRQDIYEWDGAALNHMIGPVTAGHLWTAVEYYEFVYLSNASVGVVRNPNTGLYSLTTDYPIVEAICDFNGQAMSGGLVE